MNWNRKFFNNIEKILKVRYNHLIAFGCEVIFLTYNKTLDYIHSLGNFSLPSGLDRIKVVLEKLGNPQNNFKAIHIAGTNGKGSVSAMLSSVFKIAGYKTGTFISPFIIDFRERIQINGEFISENDLIRYSEKIRKLNIELTEFEFITAVAFLYFAEQKIDILICETGLGGRLDATNTLDNLACAVITKIGLDHTAILGDTLEKIALEKCGIIRDCPTVTSPYQYSDALNIIKKQAKKLYIPETEKLGILTSDITGNTFIYKGDRYETGLSGGYQVENALIVIDTIKYSGYNIPYNVIYEGLKNAHFPARLEIISKSPLVVLDGAHNVDGAKVLGEELQRCSGKITAIVGMMKDKNVDEVLKCTLKHCDNCIAVSVPDLPRSMKESEISDIASKYCSCKTAENLQSAIAFAKEVSQGGPIFVFGSLYLASAIRPLLKEKFKK